MIIHDQIKSSKGMKFNLIFLAFLSRHFSQNKSLELLLLPVTEGL